MAPPKAASPLSIWRLESTRLPLLATWNTPLFPSPEMEKIVLAGGVKKPPRGGCPRPPTNVKKPVVGGGGGPLSLMTESGGGKLWERSEPGVGVVLGAPRSFG